MNYIKKWITFVFLFLFLFSFSVPVIASENFSTTPKNNNGKKWRVGYYEGGEYIDFQLNMIEIIKSLMDMGWLERAIIPPQKGEQTTELWKWLTTSVKSNYIEFVKDGYYTAKWDDNVRKTMAQDILTRLSKKKDIDLMIAAGTWAGLDIANDKHSVPTIVIVTADPLKAGIIKSIDDSGYDNVHARIDPYRYERQIRIFHDIIGFQKLGVAYQNTVEGRTYAAVDKIEKVAKEIGFQIVPCYTQGDIPDKELAENIMKDCFKKMCKDVDAIYLTVGGGVTLKSVPKLAKIAYDAHIPTFAQNGSDDVKKGILLSISAVGYKYVGRFYAETICKVFNGAKPRQLKQIFEDPPKIAINLKTAEIIGYDPPVDVLGAADEIFQEITTD